MAAVITPTEDQVFDAMWGWVVSLFDVTLQGKIFKGFQNITSTPYDSYIVVSPGVKQRTDHDCDAGFPPKDNPRGNPCGL